MKIRNINKTSDWIFGRGHGNYVSGLDALKLSIAMHLRSWVEDCYFDQDKGVDWKNIIGHKNTNMLNTNIRIVLLDIEGVIGVDHIQASFFHNTRNIIIHATINTIFGMVDIKEINNA